MNRGAHTKTRLLGQSANRGGINSPNELFRMWSALPWAEFLLGTALRSRSFAMAGAHRLRSELHQRLISLEGSVKWFKFLIKMLTSAKQGRRFSVTDTAHPSPEVS